MFSKGASIKNPQPTPCSLVENGASLRDGDKVRVSALAMSAPHGTGPSWAIEQEIKGTRLEREKCSVFAEDMVLCVKCSRKRGPCSPPPALGSGSGPPLLLEKLGQSSCTAPKGCLLIAPHLGKGRSNSWVRSKGHGGKVSTHWLWGLRQVTGLPSASVSRSVKRGW